MNDLYNLNIQKQKMDDVNLLDTVEGDHQDYDRVRGYTDDNLEAINMLEDQKVDDIEKYKQLSKVKIHNLSIENIYFNDWTNVLINLSSPES